MDERILAALPHDERERLPLCTVYVDGHRTTVRLEPIIWDALQKIANEQKVSVHQLVSDIDRQRTTRNLSSAIRTYVVAALLAKAR